MYGTFLFLVFPLIYVFSFLFYFHLFYILYYPLLLFLLLYYIFLSILSSFLYCFSTFFLYPQILSPSYNIYFHFTYFSHNPPLPSPLCLYSAFNSSLYIAFTSIYFSTFSACTIFFSYVRAISTFISFLSTHLSHSYCMPLFPFFLFPLYFSLHFSTLFASFYFSICAFSALNYLLPASPFYQSSKYCVLPSFFPFFCIPFSSALFISQGLSYMYNPYLHT